MRQGNREIFYKCGVFISCLNFAGIIITPFIFSNVSTAIQRLFSEKMIYPFALIVVSGVSYCLLFYYKKRGFLINAFFIINVIIFYTIIEYYINR